MAQKKPSPVLDVWGEIDKIAAPPQVQTPDVWGAIDQELASAASIEAEMQARAVADGLAAPVAPVRRGPSYASMADKMRMPADTAAPSVDLQRSFNPNVRPAAAQPLSPSIGAGAVQDVTARVQPRATGPSLNEVVDGKAGAPPVTPRRLGSAKTGGYATQPPAGQGFLDPVGDLLHGATGAIGTAFGTASGAARAIPTAIGETVFGQDMPGHAEEVGLSPGQATPGIAGAMLSKLLPQPLWDLGQRLYSHGQMVQEGRGGEVASIGPVKAFMPTPDSFSAPANEEEALHRAELGQPMVRPRSRAEQVALETGRRGLDLVAQMATDPAVVASGGVPGVSGKLMAAAFSVDGIATAVQVASDPNATAEDVAEAVLGAAIQTLPAGFHAVRPAIEASVKGAREGYARGKARREALNAEQHQGFEHAKPVGGQRAGAVMPSEAIVPRKPPDVWEVINDVVAPSKPQAAEHPAAVPTVAQTTFSRGDTVRIRGEQGRDGRPQPVHEVESVGEDGWIYLKSGASVPDASALEHATPAPAKGDHGEGAWSRPVAAEFTPVGGEVYAGQERRGEARVSTAEEDRLYSDMRDKLARGESTVSAKARADFAERQRVEDARPEEPPREAEPEMAQIDALEEGWISQGMDPKRLTIHERRELRRMLAELDAVPFTKHTFNEGGVGKGGNPEIVGGAAGAPVFEDIGSGDSRGKVARAIRDVLDGKLVRGKVSANGNRAIQTARDRIQGVVGTSSPILPPDAGDEEGVTYVDATPDMTKAEHAIERPFRQAVENRTNEMVALYRKRNGSIIDADRAKKLADGYDDSAETRAQFNRAVHRTSSALKGAVYRTMAAEPTPEGKQPEVTFVAGPTGSGKTTVTNTPAYAEALQDSQVIVDGPLSQVGNAQRMIQYALDHDKTVRILYVHRDPVEAWGGVVARGKTEGRQPSVDYHINSHVEGLRTIHMLADIYADEPRVSIEYVGNAEGQPIGLIDRADLPRGYNADDVRHAIESGGVARQAEVSPPTRDGDQEVRREVEPRPAAEPAEVRPAEEVAAPPNGDVAKDLARLIAATEDPALGGDDIFDRHQDVMQAWRKATPEERHEAARIRFNERIAESGGALVNDATPTGAPVRHIEIGPRPGQLFDSAVTRDGTLVRDGDRLLFRYDVPRKSPTDGPRVEERPFVQSDADAYVAIATKKPSTEARPGKTLKPLDESVDAPPKGDVWQQIEQATEPPREFSSTQVDLPPADADAVAALAKTIPDADLAEDGRETEPHITVKFGLHTENVEDVRRVLAGEPPITITLGKTSIFPAKEGAAYDVVKVDVDSPDLHRLNDKIAEALPNTDTHPTYKPHVTLAYVKPGLGKKYAGRTDLEGRTITFDAITFSGKDRSVVAIPLTGTAASGGDVWQQIDSVVEQPSSPTPVKVGNYVTVPGVRPAKRDAFIQRLNAEGFNAEYRDGTIKVHGAESIDLPDWTFEPEWVYQRDEVVDKTDAGDQPRLPGAESARQAGKADTTFKAPQQASGDDFMLGAEETPAAKAKREAAERGPSMFEEPAETPATEKATDQPTTYWKGDKAVYTRKTQELHGATFHELELLEGHRKGDVVLTQQAPKAETSIATKPTSAAETTEPLSTRLAALEEVHKAATELYHTMLLKKATETTRKPTLDRIHSLEREMHEIREKLKAKESKPAVPVAPKSEATHDAAARGKAYSEMTEAELQELLDIGVGAEPSKAAAELRRRQDEAKPKSPIPVTSKQPESREDGPRGAAKNYAEGDRVGVEGRAATVVAIQGEDVRVRFDDGTVVLHHGSRLTPPPKSSVPVTPKLEERKYNNYGKTYTPATKLYSVFTIDNLPKNNTEMKAMIHEALPDVDPNDNAILNAATDAIEARLAKTLGGPNMEDAHKLEAMLTRAYRTPEKQRLQQFSTPLPIAVAVVKAAQLHRAERVLEPTAGTGNLIAPTKGSGVAVTALELDPSRVALLSTQGWSAHEADYLKRPIEKEAYDVILTNPPWGKYSTGKYGQPIAGDFEPGDVAERFIAKNVRELKRGGRLVAVMPTTMLGPSGAAFRGFLDKHGAVRAIIKSPPNAYDTRGTSVESVLLVFDKHPVSAGEKVVELDTPSWEAYSEAVGRIAERGTTQRTGDIPVTPRAERPADAGAGSSGQRPGGGVSGPAGTAVRPTAERPASVVAGVQPGHVKPVDRPAAKPSRAARATGTDATRGLSPASLDAFRSAERSERFSPYRLRTAIDGVRHPRVMVEARGLAGVEYPELTYEPSSRFKQIIKDGRASIEQAEQALAAVQANADGHHGYLAADNVGVGKAREAWLSIIELMERAKQAKRPLRLMLTTKNADNIASLIEGELPALVGKDPGFEIVRVSDYKGSRQKPGKTEPVEPLPQAEHGVYVVDSYNLAPFREALLDVGLYGIIGDEAHRFKNAEASVGAAWQQIHANVFANIPRAEQAFVYFTATPAQAVEDYSYLYGLRLWPIDGFQDWVDMVTGQATEEEARQIRDAAEQGGYDVQAVAGNDTDSVVGGDSADTARGDRPVLRGGGDVFSSRLTPAEGEQITREWKRMGRFSSRDLWREGTEFVVHTEEPSVEAVERYDAFAKLARDIIDAATKFGKMNKAVRSGIGGVKSQLQFAAKRIQMQPSLEAAVRLAKEHIATGHQVVLSMINVSEFDAEQGNIGAAINQINIHDIDTTNDGEIIDNGEIPEALQARAELLEQAAEIGKLPSPVTFIEDAFGPENVAFVIGQSKGREKHVAEFQDGKRPVAVISAAGSTGISLDHRVKTKGKAEGRRVFIDVQFDWSATEAIQRYGRVDRASQISAPKIIPLNFGTAAEKKFLSTIANRLASLGALSKGGSETTGTDLEEFEIDGNEANAAARNAWNALPDDTKDLFKGRLFRDPRFPAKPANRTPATIKDIMLGLMFVPTRQANEYWKDFISERDRIRAMQTAGVERRTKASVGEILRSIDLTPELTLHQVRNANKERMGILSGVVMPEMPRLREFLRDSNHDIVRRYMSFTAGDDIVAGLVIPHGRVPGLARFYGRAIESEKLDTPDKIREALKAGDHLELRQSDDQGRPWKLRQRQDGKIAVDGVKMVDSKLVTKHGIAYNAAGNWWEARDLDAVVERFPLAAPKLEATADELADSGGGDVLSMVGGSRPLPPRRGAAVPVTDRMRPSSIIERLRKGLGDIPVSVGRFRQQSVGIYKERPQAIRVRIANSVQTIAHEFGHHVDHAILGISYKDARWRDELQTMGQPTSRPSYSVKEQRQEGAAEFFRLYLIDPAAAKADAPVYFAEFERRLDEHPDVRKVLHDARADLAGLIAQDPATRGKLRIDFTGDDSPGIYRRLKEDPKGELRNLATLWIDDLQALRSAVEEMRDGRPLDARESAYVLARNARGTGGMAEGMLEHGVRGRNGRFLSGGLGDAITPVKDHLTAFSSYLVARRVLEVQRLKGKETGMSAEEAKAIIAEVEKGPQAAAMQRAADNVYAFQRGLLQYAREYHAIDDAQYKKLLTEVAYVPLQRVIDAVGGAFGSGARKIANRTSPIKRMKGSGRDIVNPLESIIRNTFSIIDMVEKNRAMQALVRQADKSAGSAKWLELVPTPQVATKFNLSQIEKDVRRELEDAGVELPDNLDLDAFVRVFTPANFAMPGQNLVTVIRDGKRQFYEVHDQALYDAITAMGGRPTSQIIEWLSKPAGLIRAGATLTPGFIARNPTRDTLVAMMQSRYGFIPVYDTLRGALSLAMGDADAKLFLTSGIQQSSLVGADRDRLRKAIERLPAQSRAKFLANLIRHPIDLMRAISEGMESATRMGEFRLALNAGGQERRGGMLGIAQRLTTPNTRATDDETLTRATLAGRDVTTDFSRGGTTAKEVSRVKAFFNARVQGYVRMAEAVKRDPTGTMLTVAALSLLSSALWWLNSDDDEYEELPEWEKNAFWHIPVRLLKTAGLKDGSSFIKVAKPFEWASLPNMTEATLSHLKGKNPDALNRLKPDDPAGLAFALIPSALLPLLEAEFNYDTYRETPVVKPWDIGLEPELQRSEWTTDTAVQIGKLLNISPAKVDHIIFGYTAGFGRGVVEFGSDPALALGGLVTPKPPAPEKKWQLVPVVGTFLRDSDVDSSSQSLKTFYDEYQKVINGERSAKRFEQETHGKGRAFVVEHKSERWVQRRDIIKAAKKELEDLGDDVNAIYAAPASKMTPEQKRQALDKAYERMVSIARQALGKPALRPTGTVPVTPKAK